MGKKDHSKIATVIRNLHPDAKVILFGSRARGDFYSDSDYDLAVISKDFKNKDKELMRISKALHDEMNSSFDIILYTPNEYEQGKKGFLPELIEKEGVEISA